MHVIFNWTKLHTVPVALYVCEILYLALKQEQRSRMFDKKVLKGEFGLNTEEVTGC